MRGMDAVRALTLNLWGDHPPLGRRLELVAEAVRENDVDLVALQAVRVHQGELPNTPETDEIRFLRGLHAIGGHSTYYQDAWARRRPSEAGHTWSSRNPSSEALHWIERDRRVDYVFVTPVGRDGRGRVRDCQLLLNGPSPDGVWASGHFGVLAEVQIGP